MRDALNHGLKNLLFTISSLDIALLLALTIILRKILIRRIYNLLGIANAIAEGDFSKEITTINSDEIGELAKAFDNMKKKISQVLHDMNTLIDAVREGRLKDRCDTESFSGIWRELSESLNHLIDAFAAPINMTTYSLNRLSKGDVPILITEEYKGDFNMIKNNLNVLIDVTRQTELVAEEIAGGNLGIEVNERSEHDRMMQALNRMIQKLNKIKNETDTMIQAVGEGRLDIRGDSEAFKGGWKELVTGVNKLIDGLSSAVSEKAALGMEMELAKKIQTALLPKSPEISGYDIAASCQPADEVGGDYYDVISVGGFDWIVIGDVSGHGVTAGLVMMMVQTAIHTVLIANPQVPPSQLLWIINRTIYENIARMDECKHMTIVVLACGEDGNFCFSGLHEDMLIRRAATGRVENIGTDGMWIGLEADISGLLSDNMLKLESGDCMVLYTDGIIEAKKDGGFFGEERLIKIIESWGGKPAAVIHAAILEELESFEKPDDVTLFVMKRV